MGNQRSLFVKNVTRDATLVEKGRVADNFFTRLKGLTWVRNLPKGDGLLIAPCSSVHTHWMLIPIDVLYVDEHDCVVDMDIAMKTWRLGRARKDARYVVELPSGTLAQIGCRVGDQLQVRY